MRILKKLHALALELLQRPKMFKLHMPRIRWHVKKLVPGILALAIIFSLITFLRPQGAGDGTIPRRSQASDLEREDVIHILLEQVKSLMEIRIAYGEMYCREHEIGPTGGFCLETSTDPGVADNSRLDVDLCDRLAKLFANKSVLDLGCGMGQYGKCLQEAQKNISWSGYDGSEGVTKATDGYVKFIDLTLPTFLGTTYDWVMSLEVGEHIPSIHEATLLKNIVRHATQGVVLSWAVPGQGGHHHVNLHENSYVIARMTDLGFEYDNNTSQELRKAAQLEWLRNTIMVFRKDGNNEK